MKTDKELKKIISRMEGKSKKEMAEILVEEEILVPTQKVRTKFKIIQTRKSFLDRIKESLSSTKKIS